MITVTQKFNKTGQDISLFAKKREAQPRQGRLCSVPYVRGRFYTNRPVTFRPRAHSQKNHQCSSLRISKDHVESSQAAEITQRYTKRSRMQL
jgi:hypothetical protein